MWTIQNGFRNWSVANAFSSHFMCVTHCVIYPVWCCAHCTLPSAKPIDDDRSSIAEPVNNNTFLFSSVTENHIATIRQSNRYETNSVFSPHCHFSFSFHPFVCIQHPIVSLLASGTKARNHLLPFCFALPFNWTLLHANCAQLKRKWQISFSCFCFAQTVRAFCCLFYISKWFLCNGNSNKTDEEDEENRNWTDGLRWTHLYGPGDSNWMANSSRWQNQSQIGTPNNGFAFSASFVTE